MKTLALLAAACFALPSARAQEARAEFPKAGFSIAPLDATPAGPTQLVATYFLPAEKGFAPNVNVIVFTSHKDLNSFIEATRKEFGQIKATIISEEQPDAHSWVVEYSARQKGTEVQFYAKAQIKDARLYLATATCLPASWAKHGPALKACVESLKALEP